MNNSIPLIYLFYCAALTLVGFSLIVAVLRKLRKVTSAAGGLTGIRQAIQRARETHPATGYPMVSPTGQSHTILGCGLVVLLVGLFAGGVGSFIMLNRIQEARLLEGEGVVIQATVIETSFTEADEGDDTYYVSYRFSPQGKDEVISQREEIPFELYQTLEAGQHVAVIYAPSQPKVARLLSQYQPGAISYAPMLLGGGGFGLCLLFVFVYLRRYNSARRLDEDGITTTVRLLDKYEQSDSESTTYYLGYQLPGGESIRHAVSKKTFTRLEVGQGFQIRYLTDQPKIFRLVDQ